MTVQNVPVQAPMGTNGRPGPCGALDALTQDRIRGGSEALGRARERLDGLRKMLNACLLMGDAHGYARLCEEALSIGRALHAAGAALYRRIGAQAGVLAGPAAAQALEAKLAFRRESREVYGALGGILRTVGTRDEVERVRAADGRTLAERVLQARRRLAAMEDELNAVGFRLGRPILQDLPEAAA
ncbi:MAG: hypothetical protein FJX46_03140 [Alphaproteobacteria bacterium]|nr:hypothetical protein [Alphaproteobacteria bacterium]